MSTTERDRLAEADEILHLYTLPNEDIDNGNLFFAAIEYKKAHTDALAEIERLREEIRELLWAVFSNTAHFDKEKQAWDSMALSDARDAGDRLVELGWLERLPGGYGRRWFYREKPAQRSGEDE